MIVETAIKKLTKEILSGRRLKRTDDLSIFLKASLAALQEGAHALQEHFCGKHIDLCTIINARSGHCSEDCKYCAQSVHHQTGVKEYPFLSQDEIIANARANEAAGVHRFSIVTSGRALCGEEFNNALSCYRAMRKTLRIGLCASHGILSREQFHALYAAGVTRYHHNIETSKRFFPAICSSHSYEDRIRTIHLAKSAGLSVCSGGIIGMGETWEDRLDMAVSLAELGIKSIPINSLMAIPGTPLAANRPLTSDEILRTVAFFRFINPTANIRLGAGRKLIKDNGASAFLFGASASITGNMLTTSGTTIKEDITLLKQLGMYV